LSDSVAGRRSVAVHADRQMLSNPAWCRDRPMVVPCGYRRVAVPGDRPTPTGPAIVCRDRQVPRHAAVSCGIINTDVVSRGKLFGLSLVIIPSTRMNSGVL